ncbi:MAG: pyridoxal-dependent decarboxylase [Euzebya sp.]
MTPEEFRHHGRQLIDWIADYHESLDQRTILPEVQPGDIRALLPQRAPEQPEPFEEILADLDRVVMPGITHWQSPGWFAYFPANTSFPSILGELASAGLAQQGMLWSTSPAATEIESHVLDWLVDLMDVPQTWKTTSTGGGVLQMSASDSTHTALVVARHRATQSGAAAEDLVVYASTQAHSSVEKGARVAGFSHVRLIATESGTRAMSAAALQTAITADLAQGLVPAFVCASVGTTGTTAVDPVGRIAEIGRQHDLWVHVDAAYAGSAMICPEFRVHQKGLESVDSYTFNPHKWLLTNFDCSVFWVADRRPLIQALSIMPPYLVNDASQSGAVIDYRDWHVPLGRRFRALKLWFVLRSYGAEGLRAMIRQHVGLAQDLAARIAAHPDLDLLAPTPFGLVSFAHREGDQETGRIVQAVNTSGTSYLTPSMLDGRAYVRVSIGSATTTSVQVERLWQLINRSAVR